MGKNQNVHDPFLLRAVEYWLDTANELTYQPIFCEWLITKKYILKYSIRNTNYELGKDVVAIDPNGIPIAFQLKGGNISLHRWRSEVKLEIDPLIEAPIQHPDIDKNIIHTSYLVTNGEIDDSVRVEIDMLNQGRLINSPLRVWTRGDLLGGFLALAEGNFPKDAVMYQRISNLMFDNGEGSPNIVEIYSFLKEILNLENATRSKEQRRRDIATGILYSAIITGPFRRQDNHVSVVKVLTILLTQIFYIVDKYMLKDKYWLTSYEIVWADLKMTASRLEKEVNESGFESALTSPFDNELLPFRKHSAITIIYSLKLAQYIENTDEYKSLFNAEIENNYKGALQIWGEASFLPGIYLAFIFKNDPNKFKIAVSLVRAAIVEILIHNGRNSENEMDLLSPYYDLDFFLGLKYELNEVRFEEKFKLSSFYLKPFIEIVVRLNEREFLESMWPEVSFIHFNEFIFDSPEDFYLLFPKLGENRVIIPKPVESWLSLRQESELYHGENLPKTIKRFPGFLPFLLSLLPYKANSYSLGYLDRICSKKEIFPTY